MGLVAGRGGGALYRIMAVSLSSGGYFFPRLVSFSREVCYCLMFVEDAARILGA